VPAQLGDAVVVERAHRRLLERADDALRLAVRPRVVRLGEPVLDAEGAAHRAERVVAAVVDAAAARIAELNPVVRQHGVDAVRHRAGKHLEERGRDERGRAAVHPSERHLRGAVDRDE
jgi:hypothetical protein